MVHEEHQRLDEVSQADVSPTVHDSDLETPKTGPDLRVNQQVTDALAASPGGDKLDKYFGISSDEPEQPPEEAQDAGELADRLREATSSGQGDLTELLGQISQHADSSGADPDALRALMRGARKPQPTDQEESEG